MPNCVVVKENGSIEFFQANDYTDYQKAVGGLITGVYSRALPEDTTIFANDEGLLIGMDYNFVASSLVGTHLVGPVVFAGPPDEEGEVTDVTQEVTALVLANAWLGEE